MCLIYGVGLVALIPGVLALKLRAGLEGERMRIEGEELLSATIEVAEKSKKE
jgi:hypothetical protein